MFNDRPIHIAELTGIYTPTPHAEPSVTLPIWITQSSLDGLQALIRYCEGYEHNGKGRVTGGFELVMFYREIQHKLYEANRVALERADAAHGEGEKK